MKIREAINIVSNGLCESVVISPRVMRTGLGLNGDEFFTPSAHDFAQAQCASPSSRWTLTRMNPQTFLMLAQDGHSPDKAANVAAANGMFRDIPNLMIDNQGGGYGQVVGHEGRHRARWLLDQGVTDMPVMILCRSGGGGGGIRWGDVASGRTPNNIPHTLRGEDDRHSLPMPTSVIYPAEPGVD